MKHVQASMARRLDLADIQGNIVRPYGRFGFPITRHMFLHIGTPAAGRAFVEAVRHRITTAQRWGAIDGARDPHAPARPLVCLNIGFSFRGLLALELPTRTLRGLPEEFIDGMARRWSILGDIGSSAPDKWDPIWPGPDGRPGQEVHVWVSLNAQAKADGTPIDELDTTTRWIEDSANRSGEVRVLQGHKGTNAAYQDSSAIMQRTADGSMIPTAKEHFGFTDGIGDPTFSEQYEPQEEALEVIGSGKLRSDGKGWAPLATGEFILGHPSEAQELPPCAPPWSFMRNGTFMVYRKLHQNVATFAAYVAQQAALLQKLGTVEGDEPARETLMAKMVGRWRNGIPLAAASTYAAAQALEREWSDIPAIQAKGSGRSAAESKRLAGYDSLLTNFRYSGDEQGLKCPVSAHIRRTNPRDALDPTLGTPGVTADSALTNRRRIMRRGAPYGDSSVADDSSEHGVIFMALCASLFRQFEFIQQQWVHYGASFNVGNDTDPLVGLRRQGAKFVIPAEPKAGKAPFICANVPEFVETRGGEYFFLPSLTALREIAQGSVDPT